VCGLGGRHVQVLLLGGAGVSLQLLEIDEVLVGDVGGGWGGGRRFSALLFNLFLCTCGRAPIAHIGHKPIPFPGGFLFGKIVHVFRHAVLDLGLHLTGDVPTPERIRQLDGAAQFGRLLRLNGRRSCPQVSEDEDEVAGQQDAGTEDGHQTDGVVNAGEIHQRSGQHQKRDAEQGRAVHRGAGHHPGNVQLANAEPVPLAYSIPPISAVIEDSREGQRAQRSLKGRVARGEEVAPESVPEGEGQRGIDDPHGEVKSTGAVVGCDGLHGG
jgi:hypothetical protein